MLVVLKDVGCWTQFSLFYCQTIWLHRRNFLTRVFKLKNKIYQYLNEEKARTTHLIIDCDLNMQLTNLSDVCGKLHSVNTSVQDGGDKILQLNNNFKLFIREVEL